MDKKLKKQLSEIKLLICDIDGVLTDGSFIKSTSGDELRSFNALDGVGFVMLRLLNLNIKTAWITGRESLTTTQRAEELQIDDVYNGVIRKIDAYDELKKKYSAEIVGFVKDKDRIPGIDISVSDKEVWKSGNFEAKIIYIPGHTSGHIAFYFYKNEILFSGDTLFSLGCGRVFEGTHEDMYNSLSKFKSLPLSTKVYCGHEYTYNNSLFCIKYDSENIMLKKKIIEIEKKLRKKEPTIPSTIKDELECNIFLRAKTLAEFSKLRDLKDNI